MKLRWMHRKATVTAKQVSIYAAHHSCTMMEAKQILQRQTAPVLQQWWECEQGGEWRDIEVHVEAHPA